MLLTICIPTFNRISYLEDTIKSIYDNLNSNLNCFEVIILDNCSTDTTSERINILQKSFSNLIYYKNEYNIGASNNIIKCMNMAKGEYIKLVNDTALFELNSVDFLIESIKENMQIKPILFFSNINKSISFRKSNNYSAFILNTSFLTTSILSFGIWNDDFKKINPDDYRLDLNLPSLTLLSKNFEFKQSFIIINKLLFKVQFTTNKGGYNLIDVFVFNYLGEILFKDFKLRKLTYFTYLVEKNKLLLKFIIPWLKILKKPNSSFKFLIDGAYIKMFKYYMVNPLFYLMIVYFFFFDIIQKFKK